MSDSCSSHCFPLVHPLLLDNAPYLFYWTVLLTSALSQRFLLCTKMKLHLPKLTRQSWTAVLALVWAAISLSQSAVSTAQYTSSGTVDGSEEWGYVDVRKGAHMFWWLYKTPNQTTTDWPIVLWLQGGPGGSGVGIGNFGEIGPLTMALLPRQYTWLHKAHVLFVDSPVGAGFSFVDNESLLLTKDKEVAADLVSFLQTFFTDHERLQSNPLFIFGESYGGKHATLLGLALNQAIKKGSVNITFGGVALGDSWISPVDSVLSWGPVLKSFSRIDDSQENVIIGKAQAIQADVNKKAYTDATADWGLLQETISNLSNGVDFYNLLLDATQDSLIASLQALGKNFVIFGSYVSRQLLKEASESVPDLTTLMNGPVRKKLKIIPDSVIWNEVSNIVFAALKRDFMKPIVSKVDELLTAGVNVTIYSGQLDLICATQGTESWIQKLRWTGMSGFKAAIREPLYCKGSGGTAAFVKRHENLAFYWILLAGHMVPPDNPCMALEMAGRVVCRSETEKTPSKLHS